MSTQTPAPAVESLLQATRYSAAPGATRDLHTTITASVVETAITPSPPSFRLALYMILLCNTSAAATIVTIREATGGVVRAIIPVPAADVRGVTLSPTAPLAAPDSYGKPWTAQSSASITSLEVTVAWVVWP